MKHLKILFCFVVLGTTIVKAQFTKAGNGISKTSDSIYLGGTMQSNINFLGNSNSNKYDYFLNEFKEIQLNANRVNIVTNDSVILSGGSLIKLISSGNIHLGAANAVVVDGNLFLKSYKTTNTNQLGLLQVDTCGRLSIATNINLDGYWKVGGNNLVEESYWPYFIGSNDSASVTIGSFRNSDGYYSYAKSNIFLRANGDVDIHGKGKIAIGRSGYDALTIGEFKNRIGSQIEFYTHNGNGDIAVQNGMNLMFNKLHGVGASYSFHAHYITQNGSENTGSSGIFEIGGSSIKSIGSNAETFGLKISSSFDVTEIGNNSYSYGILVDPFFGGQVSTKLRALQTNAGHVVLNRYNGNTVIGSNTINGKKLQVEGDASISGGLVLGDTVTENSALLHINTTTQGFLPPRLTTSNRNNITSPANGLIIYNTDSSWLEVNTPNGWYKLLSNTINSGGGHQSRSSIQNTAETAKSSFVSRIGDGKTTNFTINHNLNSEFVMVQFIDCGAEANCNLLLSIPDGARLEMNGKNEVHLTFKEAPAYNRYKIMFLKIQ